MCDLSDCFAIKKSILESPPQYSSKDIDDSVQTCNWKKNMTKVKNLNGHLKSK